MIDAPTLFDKTVDALRDEAERLEHIQGQISADVGHLGKAGTIQAGTNQAASSPEMCLSAVLSINVDGAKIWWMVRLPIRLFLRPGW